MTEDESGAILVESGIPGHLAYVPDAWGTVRALGIDKYPGEMAIVRELVQNADDAFDRATNKFPTYVKFSLGDDELVMEHNGMAFSKPPEDLLRKGALTDDEEEELSGYDFARISRIGVGKTDEEMTGKFGTGFTSVFHITDNPRIESNGWDFEIRIGKDPLVREILDDGLTRIRLPYRHVHTQTSSRIGAEVFDEEKRDRFREQILSESYRMMFFLKNIERIEVVEDQKPLFCVKRTARRKKTEIADISCKDVTIMAQEFEGRECRESQEKWWIYSRREIPIPSRFDELGLEADQEVWVAISKGAREIGDKLGVRNHSYFTFPIKETRFRFKYNASRFFTTTDRSEFIIKEGLKNDWNEWQIENLACLLTRVVSDLVLRGKRPDLVYMILPHRHQYNHPYDKHLLDAFRQTVMKENLSIFFTSRAEWVGPKGTYIGDQRLERVLPRRKYRHFVDQRFTGEYGDVCEYYGATRVSYRDLITYLERNQHTEDFERRFDTTLTRQKTERLRKMLEYLESSHLDTEDIERLKTIDFILTEASTLRSADYRVYFPSGEDMPLINPDDIVHHSIYTSNSAESFLRHSLGIKKMDLRDLILDSFLRRLDQYDEKQKLDFVTYLARHAGQVGKSKGTLDELMNNAWKALKVEENNREDRGIYFPGGELERVFGDRLNYLSHEYEGRLAGETRSWKHLFKEIGVREIPPTTAIVRLAVDTSNGGFSDESAHDATRLFEFVSRNLEAFSEEERVELKELNNYQWIPCETKSLDFPDATYVDKGIKHLVGGRRSFTLLSVDNDDPLVQLLEMPTEPIVDDVVDYLLDHCSEINRNADRQVDHRIYKYLDAHAEALNGGLAGRMRQNRTVWHAGRLWYPRNVLLKSHAREFGPSGEVRAYVPKLNGLKDLCSRLHIREDPKVPDDYVAFLLDVSERADRIEVGKWKRYVKNAQERLAYGQHPLSEEQKQALSESRIVVVDSDLKCPRECFLVRETDRFYKERMERSGLASVPFVVEKDPKKEKFFLSIGMNEIYDCIVQKRADGGESRASASWDKRLSSLVPWIHGYGYYRLGDDGLLDLGVLEGLGAFQVHKLRVSYGIVQEGRLRMGSPIEDICCLENSTNGRHVLSLDASFDDSNNEHLLLLSALLSPVIPPLTGVTRVDWIMLMSQYFRFGQISGITRYYTAEPQPPMADREEEETAAEVNSKRHVVDKDESREARGMPVEQEATDRETGPRSVLRAGAWAQDGIAPPKAAASRSAGDRLMRGTGAWQPDCSPEGAEVAWVAFQGAPTVESTSRGVRQESDRSRVTQGGNRLRSEESLTREDLSRIGRWGERYVVRCLESRMGKRYPEASVEDTPEGFQVCLGGRILANVRWLNKSADTGKGCDIEVLEGDTKDFIEVKCTTADDRDWFEVTRAQWRLAQEARQRFHVYLVRRAGSARPQVQDIEDPTELWRQGLLQAQPVRIML
jgi:hypothetical protein